jgi:hypothetical protein
MWGWIKRTAKKVWRGVRGAARFLAHVVITIIGRVLGIFELLFSLLGLRLRKYMELSVIILKDATNKYIATVAEVDAVVDEAKRVFREEANVRLRQPSVYDSIVREHQDDNPTWVLNPNCNEGAFKHIFTRVGGWFENERANGGVTIFVVEDVQGEPGCHIGPFAEWGYIDPDALRDSAGAPATGGRALTLAHELGHSCQLFHRDRRDNLMVKGPSRRTQHLDRWQRAWLRSSWRVHYFSRGQR